MVAPVHSSLFRRYTGAFALLLACASLQAAAQDAGCRLERNAKQAVVPVLANPRPASPFPGSPLQAQLEEGYSLYYRAQQFERAQSKLRSALDLSISQTNRCGEALAAFGLALVAHHVDPPAVEGWLLRSQAAFLEVHSDSGVARVHMELGELKRAEGKQTEATALFLQAANEFTRLGEHDSAIRARFRSIPQNDPDFFSRMDGLQQEAHALGADSLQSDILFFSGDMAFQRGTYDRALDLYRQADRILQTCQCDPDQRAFLQTSLGRLERKQGRPEAAIPRYRLALALQRQAHDRAYIPQTLNAIGVAYEAMGDYPRAILYTRRALLQAQAIHSRPFIDFLNANLGMLYYQDGQPRLGKPLLEWAVAHSTSVDRLCIRRGQLAEIDRATGHLQDAEDQATQSIAACRAAGDTEELSNRLGTRALIRLSRGELEDALEDSRSALAAVEQIRSHLVPEDAHKRGYSDRSQELFDTTIAILTRMQKPSESLEVAEQSRARALLDLLSSAHSGEAQRTSSDLGVPLREAGSGDAELLASRIHIEALRAPEILDVAARLNSTMLAYWVANDTIYLWVVRPGMPILERTQPFSEAKLAALIARTRPDLHAASRGPALPARGGGYMESEGSSRAAWRQLYRLLIAPVEADLPQSPGSLLTIVPHKSLFALSFAALLDPHGHYLVERYAIHTIPAAGLLRFTEENENIAAHIPPHYLLLGNPSHFPKLPNLRLPPLPGTGIEIRSVQRWLPVEQVSVLEGNQAGLSNLLAELPRATVVHLATHAIVSETGAEESFLALNGEGKAGELTADAVYKLHLKARLVVLSACRTGLGPITGDGVLGLTHAFFYAGSASILTTLWDVADAPTSRMLPLFYRAMEAGESRSQALRTAELSLLSDLRHGRVRVGSLRLPENPIFWAAFSLSGQP